MRRARNGERAAAQVGGKLLLGWQRASPKERSPLAAGREQAVDERHLGRDLSRRTHHQWVGEAHRAARAPWQACRRLHERCRRNPDEAVEHNSTRRECASERRMPSSQRSRGPCGA